MSSAFTIFFDCHPMDSGFQGTTTYLAGVINALPAAAAQHAPALDLKIICAAQTKESVARHVKVDFEFVPIKYGFLQRNFIDIPRALRRTGANLVVSQYVRPFFSPCPTMSVIHDVLFLDYPESFSWSYRTVRRLLFGWAARNSTIVSTVSDYSAKRIGNHFGIDASEILVSPNAVDPVFFHTATKPAETATTGPIRLLSVSRLERRKRHEWGIAAVESLVAEGIDSELTIVGSGEGAYADELRAMIGDARTTRGLKIKLKSNVGFSDLVTEYANCDVFLFPSEAEGFGIPVIEAAAAGKPCVCSNGSALAELEPHFCGVSFPPGDIPAFLAAVQKVVTNLDHYSAVAKAQREAVAVAFNWKEAAKKYVAVLNNLKEETS